MERQYLALLREILEGGTQKGDRTGTGTLSVFGRLIRHDLRNGFPLITTKKLHFKSIAYELLWFLRGDTNIKFLTDNKVSIWNEWATPEGELGPVYGAQWRKWKSAGGMEIDQIENLIQGIRRNPNSRRHIVNAWNVAFLPDESNPPEVNAAQGKMALAPCHVMYQFYVLNGRVSCMLTMRSVDVYLGLPYNCASVALLTMMVAQQCQLEAGEVIYSLGDAHLYSNHLEQAKLQLQREPFQLPTVNIKRVPPTIFDYSFEDFELSGYDAHPHISAPIAR